MNFINTITAFRRAPDAPSENLLRYVRYERQLEQTINKPLEQTINNPNVPSNKDIQDATIELFNEVPKPQYSNTYKLVFTPEEVPQDLMQDHSSMDSQPAPITEASNKSVEPSKVSDIQHEPLKSDKELFNTENIKTQNTTKQHSEDLAATQTILTFCPDNTPIAQLAQAIYAENHALLDVYPNDLREEKLVEMVLECEPEYFLDLPANLQTSHIAAVAVANAPCMFNFLPDHLTPETVQREAHDIALAFNSSEIQNVLDYDEQIAQKHGFIMNDESSANIIRQDLQALQKLKEKTTPIKQQGHVL